MYNKVTFLVTNTAVVGIQLLLVALSRNKCCFFQFCWLPVVFSNTTQGFHLSLSVLLPSKMGSLSCSFLLAGDLKILCRSLLGWYLFWLEVESLAFDLFLSCIQLSKQAFHCLLLGLFPVTHHPIWVFDFEFEWKSQRVDQDATKLLSAIQLDHGILTSSF